MWLTRVESAGENGTRNEAGVLEFGEALRAGEGDEVRARYQGEDAPEHEGEVWELAFVEVRAVDLVAGAHGRGEWMMSDCAVWQCVSVCTGKVGLYVYSVCRKSLMNEVV